eukprot:TRINITY_DN2881_c0_g1_i1.p1 TRINITY_DN2881_c0_g1~~TRINITY_DN2881_c0_g1_i1.p1  ORF type:complete len:316 (+),score=76.79 TRINITY_DN2881_c0_g1_i1:148-1095(+)
MCIRDRCCVLSLRSLGWLAALSITYHFFATLYQRLGLLTFKSPTIPRGRRRKVTFTANNPVQVGIEDSNDVIHLFLSFFIVPYESMVVYIDQRLCDVQFKDDPNPPQMLLSYQEKQHSAIHLRLNQRLSVSSYLFEPFRKLTVKITKMLLPLEGTIAAMIAIFESIFYYLDGVDGLFETFKGDGLWEKVFLWHYYEELEHHCESTYGFTAVYGWQRVLLLPLSLVLYLGLVTLIHLFSLAFVLSHSPILRKPILIVEIWNHWAKMMGGGVMATVLLVLNLHSKDHLMLKDLTKYRNKFEERFNQSLDVAAFTMSN